MPVACKFLPGRERFLKCFDDFLAVFRSLFTALQCLDDFSADRPIGDHHAGVDGPDKFSPGLLQKGDDPFDQSLRSLYHFITMWSGAMKADDFAKSPDTALRCILRH